MDFNQNIEDITSYWRVLNRYKEPFLFQVFKAREKYAPRKIVTSKKELVAQCRKHKGSGVICLSVNPRDKEKVSGIESVKKIRNGLIDIDVKKERKKQGVSTQEDKKKAEKVAKTCINKLDQLGIQPSLFIDSGNGFHIYFSLSLSLPFFSNKKEWRETILYRKLDQLTEKLANLETNTVEIDCITKDIARRVKIAGTYNVKPEIPENGAFRKAKIIKKWKNRDPEKNNKAIKKIELTQKKTSSPDLGAVKEIKPEDKEDRPSFKTILEDFDDKKMKNLFNGKWKNYDYPSRSEAELALCQKLVFYQFDREEIHNIMPKAGIGKWNEAKPQYQTLTIDKALQYQKERIDYSSIPKKEEKGGTTWNFLVEEIWENGDLNNKTKHTRTAKELVQKFHFRTPYTTEKLYLYRPKKGIYDKHGEQKIRKVLEQFLGKYLSKHDKNEIITKIKQKTFWKRPFSPKNPWLLPLKNGIFDIKNMELKPHSSDYFFTTQLPYPYDKESNPNKFLKFVYQVVDTDFIPLVQEMTGYCLYRGYPFRKLFLLLGDQGIGKSILLKVLFHFLGGASNICSEEIQKITNTRFAQYQLYQKRANIFADVPSNPLHKNSYLKMLTGGDLISAEIKRVQERVKFYNYAKLIFSGNEAPKLSKIEDAMIHRFLPIKCRKQWKNKTKRQALIDQLTTEKQLSGILNWALIGLKRVFKNDGFWKNDHIKQFKKEWLIQANPLHVFLKDIVEKSVKKFMPKQYFYQNLAVWCEEHGVSPPSKTYVGRNLAGHLPGVRAEKRTHEGKRKRCWIGIDWVNEPPTGKDKTKVMPEMKNISLDGGEK